MHTFYIILGVVVILGILYATFRDDGQDVVVNNVINDNDKTSVAPAVTKKPRKTAKKARKTRKS